MEGRSRVSIFEEFIALFGALREATKCSPERLVAFHDQSKEISETISALQHFLWRTDFERHVFHGSGKIIARAPSGFTPLWEEYDRNWSRALAHIALREMFPEAAFEFDPDVETPNFEPESPDPESDESFDPLQHDGGAALELGIERLEIEAEFVIDESNSNASRIAIGAYDYLKETIGFNAHDVFRRWRKIPVIFLPAHVSNRYGASDRGSLPSLLNDAVRAYVFGAPAAAFAMCRAAFEMILKRHYGDGAWEDPREKLAKVVALANERGFIKREEVKPLIDRADGILHRYSQEAVITAEDERTILIFLATLKSLIEQAPKP